LILLVKDENKMDKKTVVLTGATGYLGEKIAKELIAQGANVRAMVRATSNRTNLEKLGVTDFVTGDMLDLASLDKALAKSPKADALVASAAGYTGHTKGDNPKTDTEGYKNLADVTKKASISRFVLISILECDKAKEVPHFYHKHLVEKYLREIDQPFIALRPGAFLDQAKDFVLPKVQKGTFPAFVPGVSMGMIYTGDLARYAALAAINVPDRKLGTTVDVGWEKPVSGEDLAETFSKVLGKKVVSKPAFPGFVVNLVLPFIGMFNPGVKDMYFMIKWIKTGAYKSTNTQKQRELFSDLPTVEEAVRRYCKDKQLV
jgi:uncharacterized protein YbjT (DUF2867 family)